MGGVLLVANDTALVFSDTLCRGLSLADIPVGGLSVGEAEKIVTQALTKRQAEPVLTLQYGEKKWDVPWDIVRNRPDAASLVRRAYGVGRTGNLLERSSNPKLRRKKPRAQQTRNRTTEPTPSF